MHSPVHIMAIRLHHEEMQRKIASDRLGRKLLAARKGEARLAQNVRWELARVAGLLGKHFK